ncbi:MAG: helix-turn-helix domain-containing protein [Bacilli bacterium]|nr:helix-turn-helix domain-containing protein [Bacilli bacterium]
MAKETFGQRLARLRKEREMTQSDIADNVGVTSQAVSKWENDQASPDIDILIKLSEIFNISLDELLGKEKTTSLSDKPSKKDIDKMIFKIVVLSDDGDKVNVNLPMALIKIFINKEDGKLNFISGEKNKALENIDFKQLIEMVEQGVVGELVSVDSADGTKVSIWVE